MVAVSQNYLVDQTTRGQTKDGLSNKAEAVRNGTKAGGEECPSKSKTSRPGQPHRRVVRQVLNGG